MKSISFDNPWLLLVAIPLLLLIIIPFLMAIRKENKSKSTTASIILHILIVVCVVLAAAGTIATTVMTETHVYVVADVSYSSHENLDKVDQYISELKEKLPENSKVGVICFGKDYVLHTPMGEDIATVKTAKVDDSATNISQALNYAATLFRGDVIKRVVLITDGKETNDDATAELIRSVENLHNNNVYLDAIYLDNNLPENAIEVQVSGVDFTPSTYMNHASDVSVLVESGFDGKATVSLSCNGEKVTDSAVTLSTGYNIVNFDLDTSASGTFDYEVTVQADGDLSPYNNAYRFTQTVAGNLHILLVSSDPADLEKAQALYGDFATIDAFINDPNVPCTIEEMCLYDEIILSNVDVRELKNYTAFVSAIDTAVSMFGKSLLTFGDLKLQSLKEEEVLEQLGDILPVKFGNSDQEAKLYGIVVDTSRSMQNASRLIMAKTAAIQLLNLLNDEDYVTVITFSGDVSVVQAPTKAYNRDEIAQMIMSIEPSQGTYIGLALEQAYQLMALQPYSERQIMLISDGMTYSLEPNNAPEVARKLREIDIYTSVLNTASSQGESAMKEIAASGGGYYYSVEDERDLEDLMFSKIADDLTESIIEGEAPVNIKIPNDEILLGISSFPPLQGFVYAKEKASATTVLSTEYEKSEGVTIQPPVYAYWNYGNGRVSSFTGTFTGKWVEGWEGSETLRFFTRMAEVNTPEERIDYPFTLNIDFDGTYSKVEIVPVTLNLNAKTTVTVTLPDGTTLEEVLTFDSSRYYYDFATPHLGKYAIEILYEYGGKSFTTHAFYNISYSPEYDRFVIFDPASLHEAIRNRGTVTEGAVPVIQNDENEVATYTVSYAVPLLIAAVALFVIDVFIRKIKWKDIVSLFGKKA